MEDYVRAQAEKHRQLHVLLAAVLLELRVELKNAGTALASSLPTHPNLAPLF